MTTLFWPKAPNLLRACRALGKTLQKAADFLVISKLCNGRTVMQAFAGLLGGNIPNWFWYMCEYRLQQCDRCPNGKECQRLEGSVAGYTSCLLRRSSMQPGKNHPTIYTFLEISKPSSPLQHPTNWIFLFRFLSSQCRPPVIGFILFCSSTTIGQQFQTEPV